ncbi:hypothetical protein D3C81_1402780 [compost metagenome]
MVGGRHVVRLGRGPALAVEDGAQRMADGVRISGLRNETKRAMVECAAHHRRLFAGGHHHDRQLRMQRAQMHQRVETLRAGHVQIHQHQVGIGMLLGQRVQRFHAVSLQQLHAGNDTLHRALEGFAEQWMVIGDQQGRHGEFGEQGVGNRE